MAESDSNKFASKEEAYTHLLIEHQKMEDTMKNIQTQMSFLLMNIREGNFTSPESHAIKELKYLVSGSHKLSQQAYKMHVMANTLLENNV